MTNLRTTLRSLIFAAGLLVFATAFGEAKRPDAATAHVRVWKGDLPSKRVFKVTLRTPVRKSAITEIAVNAEAYFFSQYTPVAVGPSTIEVTDPKDAKAKLATLAATLTPGSFATLVLTEDEKRVSVEFLNDTIPSTPAHELRVRNFAAQITSLQIDAGEDIHVRLNPPDAFLHVRGIVEKKIQVRTSGVDVSGKPVQWTNEVDFTLAPRVTVLIYPDTYGRIRPRTVIDGQLLDQAPDSGENEEAEK